MLGVLVFGRSHRLMQRLLFPTFCIVGALRYFRAMPRTLRCETNEQPG